MQTTHKIVAADARSYSEYLIADSGRGDYYMSGDGSRDEGAPGVWHGSPNALSSVGLSSDRHVRARELQALMDGRSPRDGSEIRRTGGDGTRVAGIDMCFSAPKSVSALWAVSSPEHREQIMQAHERAVTSALGRAERDVELVRVRERGQLRWETANSLIAAKFTHTASRMTADQESGGVPDPQLHTHVVVLGAERRDGRLVAVDSREVLRSARANGAWYRSALAHHLMREGLQVQRGTGKDERYFELAGVPKQLTERWSARTETIDQAARDFRRRYGRDPRGGELGALTVKTRGSKSSLAPVDIDNAWHTLAGEHGLTQRQAHGLFEDRTREREPDRERDNDLGEQLDAEEISGPDDRFEAASMPNPADLDKPEDLSDLGNDILERMVQKAATVSERDMQATAYERSTGVCHPRHARDLLDRLAHRRELIELDGGMWTTRAMRERERETLATAGRRSGEQAAPVATQSLVRAERETGREVGGALSGEQRNALRTLTGRGGVATLVGRAGTGKGVVLRAATKTWHKDGYHVIGTAVAGATAERLGHDARTSSAMTVDALIHRVENEKLKLDPKTVVVLDEGGMVDTNRLSKLVKLTAASRSKLVLAGDGAQLSPIGAGGLFDRLRERAPSAELTEVRRAQHPWERQAWEHVREGRAMRALASYKAHGRLHLHDTRAQAAERMLADWNQQRLASRAGRTVMLTDASNRELDRLNLRAQQYREREGELGARRAKLTERPYDLAEGDEVIFTKAHWRPGHKRVENGTLGTVTRVHDERTLTVRTRGAHERDVHLDTREFTALRLGYAQHVYKGQGITTDNALALIGGWQTDRERAYVALTRSREQTNIYTAREDLGHEGIDNDSFERLAEKMRESKAQRPSIDHELANTREHPAPSPTTGRDHPSTPTPSPDRPSNPTPDHNPQPDRDPTRRPEPRRAPSVERDELDLALA